VRDVDTVYSLQVIHKVSKLALSLLTTLIYSIHWHAAPETGYCFNHKDYKLIWICKTIPNNFAFKTLF